MDFSAGTRCTWTYFADWYVPPQGVAIGDISSDDCLDVVATTLWSGMQVLYGICADYNCDGVLDGGDFLINPP